MAYNQYYGGRENYMPMQNQPYYQPNAMNSSPATPRIGQTTPSTNPMPQINQMPQMGQMPQMNQVPQSSTQYQYTNNPAMNYASPVSPMAPTSIPPNPYTLQTGMMNQITPNTTAQNYSTTPSTQPQFPAMQQNQPTGVYPGTSAYNANNHVGYNNMVHPQTSNVPAALSNNAFADQRQYAAPMAYPTNSGVQQMVPIPSTQTQPVYAGEPCNPKNQQNPTQTPSVKKEEPESTFKPTYVIGEYKCSDFPTLYSGNYRYNQSPVQRKPFTMKGGNLKQGQTDRRINGGLSKYGKRWELRGGKYYGCFTSRTNGLQDLGPKDKCRSCPNEGRKK